MVTFDLSGPHIKANDEAVYLFGCSPGEQGQGYHPIRSHAEIQEGFRHYLARHKKSILGQIKAEVDDPTAVVGVHSDGRGEFTAARIFHDLFSISAAYEPEANGKAERQVKAIKEAATSLLLHADMPRSFGRL